MFWINCSSIVTFPMCNFSHLNIHRDCRFKLHDSHTSDLDLLVCLSLSTTSGGRFSATILKSKTVFPETCASDTVSVHGCSSGASSPAPSPGGNSSTRPSLASVYTPTASRRRCDFSWRLRSAWDSSDMIPLSMKSPNASTCRIRTFVILLLVGCRIVLEWLLIRGDNAAAGTMCSVAV